MSHELYMKKALLLAARGRGRTSPNPMVGAVVVKKGQIIASDYHRKAGSPHAEALVLNKLGPKARGASLYVTLEPCCHDDKRTPPCTQAIITSGIRQVIIAMVDPNPKVSGRGILALNRAGIKTEVGILGEKAARLNEAFIKYITKKQPFVILKIAQSLDGKIATSSGESQWITGEQARKSVHSIRGAIDALLVGSGTAVKDNPSLDCRIKNGRNPYRVIVDSSLRLPLNAKVLKYDDGRTIVAVTENADREKISAIRQRGHQVLIVKEKDGRVSLKNLMKQLAKLNLMSVMIEGGSGISAAALSEKIVDKVLFYIAPKIIGGNDSFPSVGGVSPLHLAHSYQLINTKTRRLGEDIVYEGYVRY